MEDDPNESAPLSIEEITENSHKISSTSMQKYLDKLADSLARDLQHHGNHKHALLLRHSKTDQYSQGKIIPISGELSEIISKWSLAIDQYSGYILRSFKRNLSTKSSLTPASINHILKSLQKKAGLNQMGELSGHSFRVGAAIDLLDKSIPLEKIMLRGGWKSETSAMRYLQSWNDSNWLIIN